MILPYLPYLSSKTILLASKSPRRRQILNLMGLPFTAQPSNFPETLDKALYPTPESYVIANAQGKALDVANSHPNHHLVIGSDTVVVQNGIILEKPQSELDAYTMLKSLSGTQHTVFTGVSLIAKGCQPTNFYEQTTVWFVHMTDAMIESYIKTGEPMDKAGAYGIQGRGGVFVRKIDGCFFAVMGLPMHAVAREIANLCEQNLL